jgi:ribose 5-phosphate isomerase B
MKIAIANDHAGVAFKQAIIKLLESKGHSVKNYGTDTEASCDYADYAHPLSSGVENGAFDYGILICGTANGMMMTANKHSNIRAGLAWTPEIAMIIRQHNNANILGIPARFVNIETALQMVNKFLETSFEGGRHQTRIEKIPC